MKKALFTILIILLIIIVGGFSFLKLQDLYVKKTALNNISSGGPAKTYYTENSNIKGYVGYTGAQIEKTLAKTGLSGLGKSFSYYGYINNINPLYLAAHAALESGWGSSIICKIKHNLYGFGAFDRDPFYYANFYSSYDDSIAQASWYVRSQYLTVGGKYYHLGTTLLDVNYHYASDKKSTKSIGWAAKIALIMNEMREKTGAPQTETAVAQNWYIANHIAEGSVDKDITLETKMTVAQVCRDLYRLHLKSGGKEYACAGAWANATHVYDGKNWNMLTNRIFELQMIGRAWSQHFSSSLPTIGSKLTSVDTVGNAWSVVYYRLYEIWR